jgi:hypothetical protein
MKATAMLSSMTTHQCQCALPEARLTSIPPAAPLLSLVLQHARSASLEAARRLPTMRMLLSCARSSAACCLSGAYACQ